MKIIGITGGIGTGKSTVLNILKNDFNAYVIEADKVAKDVTKKGQSAYTLILEAFGNDILSGDGEIDRKKLGDLVFNDPSKLDTLNEITHGKVREHIENTIDEVRTTKSHDLIVIEAALLIECGYKTICDVMWYVTADKEIRLSRLERSRGISKDRALAVMANQSDENFYKNNSDVIINNNGDLNELREKVEFNILL